MTATLGTHIKLDVKATLSEVLGVGTRSFPSVLEALFDWANGTGANQADLVFSDERTIAPAGTDTLDLAGSLSDAFGNTLTFADLKAIIVVADSGNTNNVVVGRPATNGVPFFNAASDAIALQPGAMFAWVNPGATGVSVTAGSADEIDIVNGGGGTSVTYKVILIGTSA